MSSLHTCYAANKFSQFSDPKNSSTLYLIISNDRSSPVVFQPVLFSIELRPRRICMNTFISTESLHVKRGSLVKHLKICVGWSVFWRMFGCSFRGSSSWQHDILRSAPCLIIRSASKAHFLNERSNIDEQGFEEINDTRAYVPFSHPTSLGFAFLYCSSPPTTWSWMFFADGARWLMYCFVPLALQTGFKRSEAIRLSLFLFCFRT